MSIGGIAHLKEIHRQALHGLAFPPSSQALRKAVRALDELNKKIAEMSPGSRSKLKNSGIIGTQLGYQFSFESMRWICRKYPALIEFDWSKFKFKEFEKLEELVLLLLNPAELPPFDEGEVDIKEWLQQARCNFAGSSISWLLQQLTVKAQRKEEQEKEKGGKAEQSAIVFLYNQAKIPTIWDLQQKASSLTFAKLKPKELVYRDKNFRKPPEDIIQQIHKPLRGIKLVDSKQAREIIDLATLNLTLRQREVYAFENANPDEVYLAPLGKGVELAVIGLKPEARFNLEASYGYVLLSNGMAIGYGGVSPLFFGGNTGINIFEEFRRGESSFLFVEALRAFRSLFNLSYFVVNPIQFGYENDEGVESGAFWFYYRLGFRPTDKEVARLAKREYQRFLGKKEHKFKKNFLKKIFSCDLILKLEPDLKGDFFAESNLQLIAHKSSELISQIHPFREQALAMLTKRLATSLGLGTESSQNFTDWAALNCMAPTLGLLNFQGWSPDDKLSCLALVRSKYILAERTYLTQAQQHPRFFRALKRLVRQD